MPRQGGSVLKDQTLQFIRQNPIDVALSRMVRTPDGAGGFTQAPADLPAQTVRLVLQNNSAAIQRLNGDGETVTPEYKMVCQWDADIQRTDRFEHNGDHLEVVWVTVVDYEKVAEVATR